MTQHSRKFGTRFHHLIDAIRGGRLEGGLTPEGRAEWLSLVRAGVGKLEKLPLYVLRDPVNDETGGLTDGDVLEMAFEKNAEGELRMPLPDLMLEMVVLGEPDKTPPLDDEVWIVMAHEHQEAGGMLFTRFVASLPDLTRWFVSPYVMWLARGENAMSYQTIIPEEKKLDPQHHPRLNSLLLDDFSGAGIAANLFLTLDSPSVELESVEIPREVNRGRSLLKRARVRDHTVVRLPKVVYAATGGKGGTHASPRTHWRRAHIRHLASGKVVRVPMVLVAGKPDQPPPPPPINEIVLRR